MRTCANRFYVVLIDQRRNSLSAIDTLYNFIYIFVCLCMNCL
uniref:Uncharacterized protein n=1 Tax=Rhizophora mucronata TaxID=61149 RepID=A0A2P2KPP0_RHIMU